MLRKTILNLLKSGIKTARCHHLKIFYFSLYCFLIVGCGKKVTNNPDDEQIAREALTTERVLLDATLKTNGEKELSAYDFKKDAEVRIPASIRVIEGNAGNNTAVIYFNANSNTNFDVYCIYQGAASTASPIEEQDILNGLTYEFDSCYDDLGYLNYYPGNGLIQDKGLSVILELISADSRYNTKVKTELEVDWH